jgi:hypothetical protein
MTEFRKALSWSGRMHYLQDRPEPRWALCGASPYPIDAKEDMPHHLRGALAMGREFPMCKKCEKSAAKP